jgi:hypothetical protein
MNARQRLADFFGGLEFAPVIGPISGKPKEALKDSEQRSRV